MKIKKRISKHIFFKNLRKMPPFEKKEDCFHYSIISQELLNMPQQKSMSLCQKVWRDIQSMKLITIVKNETNTNKIVEKLELRKNIEQKIDCLFYPTLSNIGLQVNRGGVLKAGLYGHFSDTKIVSMIFGFTHPIFPKCAVFGAGI